MTHPKKQQPNTDIIRYVDRNTAVSHTARMVARRERQAARNRGFTPIRNLKITAAVTQAMGVAIAANAKLRAEATDAGQTPPLELTNEAANKLAWRRVAASLPSTPIGVRLNHA